MKYKASIMMAVILAIFSSSGLLTGCVEKSQSSIQVGSKPGGPIIFSDPHVEESVRMAIDKETGELYPSDVKDITALSIGAPRIDDWTGIEYCTNLNALMLNTAELGDLSPLAELPDLNALFCFPICNPDSITGPITSDIGHISSCTEFIFIKDISPLSVLNNLTHLYIHTEELADLIPLAELTTLETLSIMGGKIDDITPLEYLANLTVLELVGNRISDITSIASLTGLTRLYFDHNDITDITSLSELTNITELGMSNNRIQDISVLANMTGLTQLAIYNAQISDLSPLINLTSLTELLLDDNKIEDITPLSNLTKLEHLSLGRNQIRDVSPLECLTNLKWLGLHENQISDISPLVKNLGLGNENSMMVPGDMRREVEYDVVRIWANPFSVTAVNEHIPELQERGVFVAWVE